MPSTVGGLIIFVILLIPGFVFQRKRSRDRPDAEETALQEVLTILFAGLMLDAAALVVRSRCAGVPALMRGSSRRRRSARLSS